MILSKNNQPERSQPIDSVRAVLCCSRSTCCPSSLFRPVFQLLARTWLTVVDGTASILSNRTHFNGELGEVPIDTRTS